MQYSVTEQMTKKVSDEFKNESNKFQFNKFIKELVFQQKFMECIK